MSNSNGDRSENSFREEKRDTSVAPLKKVGKQAKKDLKKAEEGIDAIDFLVDFLEDFLEDYGDVEKIDTQELKQIIDKYKEREEELIQILHDRESQIESLSNNESEETVEDSEVPDGIDKLEDSVNELEQLSDLSSSAMVAPQDCFLEDDKIEEIKDLIQKDLTEKELEEQIAKLGDFYTRTEDREDLKVLVVGKKGGKGKKCEFKIG